MLPRALSEWVSTGTHLHQLGTKAPWVLTHRLRNKCQALREVAKVLKTPILISLELILMASPLATEVHLGIITPTILQLGSFQVLICRTRTKTIIKTSRKLTHSRLCNSSLLSNAERTSLNVRDSWIIKRIIPWTFKTKNTTKMGPQSLRPGMPPVKRPCHLLRSPRHQVLLVIGFQSMDLRKMFLATRQYKIVITITTIWVFRMVTTSTTLTTVTLSKTQTHTCKISWTEMIKTWTHSQPLRTTRLLNQVWTPPTQRERMNRFQSISKTTW